MYGLVHLVRDLVVDLVPVDGVTAGVLVHLVRDLGVDLVLADGATVGVSARAGLWPLGTPASS